MMLEKLKNLCNEIMVRKGLSSDERYVKRLEAEFKEIDAQNEAGYFLELFDRKVRYPENENNLFAPFLLGLVPSVNVEREAEHTFGEWPDIDIDYIPIVRSYLKDERD